MLRLLRVSFEWFQAQECSLRVYPQHLHSIFILQLLHDLIVFSTLVVVLQSLVSRILLKVVHSNLVRNNKDQDTFAFRRHISGRSRYNLVFENLVLTVVPSVVVQRVSNVPSYK